MDEYIDLFDAFEQGRLSAAESEAFQQRLDEDAEFKSAFDQYEQQLKVIRALGAGEEMRALMEAHEPERQQRNLVRYLIPIGVAAALVLLFFVFGPDDQPTGPELFDEYFEPFPNLISARDNTTDISLALNAYSSGEYRDALMKLDAMAQKTDTVLFYKAMSHLSLDEADSALKYLNKVEKESTLYEFTQWYKGMAYLSLEKLDSARIFLEQVNLESVNQGASEQILKSIR